MNARCLMILSIALALSGCIYESPYENLSCTTDDACGAGADCVDGFCVTSVEADADVSVGPDAPDAEAPVATRVEVAPASAQIPIGVAVQLEATAFTVDGAQVVEPEIVWASDDETIATIDAQGVVTGQAPGTTIVTAQVDEASASATITVLAPVDSVVIEPAAPTVGKGRTLQLTARALDANGVELTGRTIDWSSADVAIASVDDDGVVTALQVGTTDITAAADGVEGTVSLEVTANPVTSVQIIPDDGTVELGTIAEFDAEIRDADDEVLDPRNRTFNWTITNAAVASLSTRAGAPQRARVQGQALGSSSIAVTVDDSASDDLAIEVIMRTVASVDIDPLNELVPVGSTRQLTTQVKDPDGQLIVGRPHTWSSSDETILTVDGNGLLTALAPGSATVSVDVEGLVASLLVETAFLLQRLDAGEDHTCGLNADGAALCWGNNDRGQLGAGPIGASSGTPVIVSGGHVFTDVRAGNGFTCAVDEAQIGHCWGAAGRLGVPGGAGSDVPVAIPTLLLTAVAAGNRHACAMTMSGEVFCWGEGTNGELGDGTSTDSNTALEVNFTPMGNVIALAAGRDHTCAATDAGKTYCWGNGIAGALGDGDTSPQPTPVEVTNAPSFIQLSLGEAVSCGRTAALDVYCWGSNIEGRLGIGDMNATEASSPTALGVMMADLSLGSQHGCAINSADDVVYCWGSGTNFRLGTNSEDSAYAPIANADALTAIDVGAGGAHSCAVDPTGVPYCWGNNTNGRTGTTVGSTVATPMPVWPTP